MKWTFKEAETILRMANQGHTAIEMREVTGRSVYAIQTKLAAMALNDKWPQLVWLGKEPE